MPTLSGLRCYGGTRPFNAPLVSTPKSAVVCDKRPDRRATRNGSKAGLTDPKSDFRSAPESGLNSDIEVCPKGAISGCEQLQQGSPLFDYFVRGDEQLRGYSKPERFRSFKVDI